MTYPSVRPYRPGGSTAGRITPLGPYFVDATGQIVIRRALTAFTLSKRYAQGRSQEAGAFLDYIASKRLNEGRVFCRTEWGPGKGGVEDGWELNEDACEQAATEAASRGLRIEFTAHTAPMEAVAAADLLKRVDELCLRHDNAQLEVWNEPQQNGGEDLLRKVLSLYTPRTPGWASGWYSTVPIGGQSLNYHSPRKEEAPRCFKDANEFQTGLGPNMPFAPAWPNPVHLGEPPQIEQTEYMFDEADWEAYGAGAAFFAAGVCVHDNPVFQRCEVPEAGSYLDRCIDAAVRGIEAVPLQRYHNYLHEDDQGALRRYSRWGDDGRKYTISVRPYAFGLA